MKAGAETASVASWKQQEEIWQPKIFKELCAPKGEFPADGKDKAFAMSKKGDFNEKLSEVQTFVGHLFKIIIIKIIPITYIS